MKNIDFKKLRIKQLSSSIEKGELITIDKIGQRIKDLRESLGMTQQQMAGRLKVNQSVISRIESNVQSSSLKTILKIVRLLECDFKCAIVSSISLEMIIREQAKKTTEKILKRTYANMAMEKQSPGRESYKYQLEELIKKLVANPSSKLWDE